MKEKDEQRSRKRSRRKAERKKTMAEEGFVKLAVDTDNVYRV